MVLLLNLHDVRKRPEDTVLMEILCWIEPKIVSFFSAQMCASVAVYIRLNPPFFASNIPQKLKINLVMILLIHVSI